MTSTPDSRQRSWLIRNRMTLLTVACLLAYAAFVQWGWGWNTIIKQWADIGPGPGLAALALLTSTYFVRCYRIYDYFPRETSGRFLQLFRLTQVHNLLNIMLPLRAGETSFPILMRSEFSVHLARATSALLVMRLLDLHALLAAAGIGLVIERDNTAVAWLVWGLFLVSPLAFFALKRPVLAIARKHAPKKIGGIVHELEAGMPFGYGAFTRAWLMTLLNWGTKVLVLAWALALMGVSPLGAAFGGALGGELSSVLPFHAPGGVGTYPAGITAGALAFGAPADRQALSSLAQASINAHLLIVASAITGTLLSLLLARKGR
ncbi:flippase-like domain-containing protein [Rhizobiaceae bacterium n13]|uniref:Flippase-like domain-containing protein n=1 Tax=Ferirhizobium litorale TaxID=2927786 RepID=A0AAE3QCG4_9HYPH|nr:lysylphosphatidylglycerol synthase domain-containing protein [Fererhizobium litorale]MDI7861213.1 flippase-like domain-containing protein [Fererhizobium litorale]MDI7921360.1 flippase-like domain-containing protein [Fererhizobium litorale]